MAESSWPNPANGRVVDDNGWEKLGISFGPTAAVYGDFTSPQLAYGDSTGMQIKIAADRYAIVRGHVWWSGSSIVTKTIASNSSGSTRIDLVVLRYSRTTYDVTVQIVQGTPGAGAPAATQNVGTTGTFEFVLAEVTVANSASTITAGNVNYVATHVGANGHLRVPNAGAGLFWVPLPAPGLNVTVADANNSPYRYDGASWVAKPALGVLGQRTLFTPTLTAATTNPTMGTGATRYGWYVYLPGPSVFYVFHVTFGTSGAAAGSGGYAISLPVTAASPNAGGIPAVGSCQLADSSSGAFKNTACFITNGGTTLGLVGDAPVNQASPWAWANSDYIAGSILYPV